MVDAGNVRYALIMENRKKADRYFLRHWGKTKDKDLRDEWKG